MKYAAENGVKITRFNIIIYKDGPVRPRHKQFYSLFTFMKCHLPT